MKRQARVRWLHASVVAACCVYGACASRVASAGLWFDADACVLRPGFLERFGDVLTLDERHLVERVARVEVARAFAPLRLAITANRDAFWRLGVVRSLPARNTRALPRAGESVALGVFGGGGTVACDVVARKAIHYAPATATRADLVEAIGKGVGRTAVHELVHQILGPSSAHNDVDPDSYEHGSSDRPSQYYGELHWTSALGPLQRRIGLREPLAAQ